MNMARVAFVFPGQGAQEVGMGKAAFDGSDEARSIFEDADKALGESLSTLCFEGPAEQLQLTANTQPAILTTSIALLRAFKESCDVAAGHSLGEYSAHVAAGTLGFEDAVKLVRIRGQYMQEAVPVGQGAMAAILGGKNTVIEKACADSKGAVQPANYNCTGQVVISGEAEGVQQVSQIIAASGAKVRPLSVSAPFHSRLMKPAEERLKPHLVQVTFNDPSIPVYTNVDAQPVTDAEAARNALIKQVSQPVLWHQTIEKMIADGVGLFVEIGPSHVLAGLIRRIDKKVRCVNVEKPDDFDKARHAMDEARS